MADLIAIRCSALPMWNDCPRRSAARLIPMQVQAAGYKLGRDRRSIGAITGTATHAAAAHSLREKMQSGSLGPESAATDVAREALREAMTGEDVIYDATTPTQAAAEKATIAQTKRYRRDVAAVIEPLLIEQKFEAEWGPILLTGGIDLVTRDEFIRDIKGGRSRPNAAQYGGYAQLAQANGYPIKGIIEDGIPRVHSTKDQPPIVSRPIDVTLAKGLAREAVKIIADQLTAFAQTQRPEVFPANPQSALCGEKYCSAWGSDWCQAWKTKVKE